MKKKMPTYKSTFIVNIDKELKIIGIYTNACRTQYTSYDHTANCAQNVASHVNSCYKMNKMIPVSLDIHYKIAFIKIGGDPQHGEDKFESPNNGPVKVTYYISSSWKWDEKEKLLYFKLNDYQLNGLKTSGLESAEMFFRSINNHINEHTSTNGFMNFIDSWINWKRGPTNLDVLMTKYMERVGIKRLDVDTKSFLDFAKNARSYEALLRFFNFNNNLSLLDELDDETLKKVNNSLTVGSVHKM